MTVYEGEWGECMTLSFKGCPIRAVPVNGVPWFVASDLCEALGYGPAALEALDSLRFPACQRSAAQELADPEVPGEPELVTILSPVGVWWWTHFTNPLRGQSLAAWAKREAARLCPKPAAGDPHVFLKLLPDGGLPPYPAKYSGRKAEWVALKESSPCSPLWPR